MQQTALVTGAARGIGLAITEQLLAGGRYRVMMIDIDATRGASALVAMQKQYGDESAAFLAADVSSETDIHRIADETFSCFGGLSLLVNNAAVRAAKPPGELTLGVWNRVLAVNLTGPFMLSRIFAPHLGEQRGSIVNICSTRALMSEAGTEAYSASKGGLLTLTHSLAMSLAPDVRVNAVSPGWINSAGESLSDEDNRQHPAGRVGACRDVAAMVEYLASDAAGFITGQNFVVDGGMTRKMIYTE